MSDHADGSVPHSFRVRIGTHSSTPISDSDGGDSSGVRAVVPCRSFKVRGRTMRRFYSLLALTLGFGVIGCDESAGPSGMSFDPFGLWSSTGEATYGQFYVTSQWGLRADAATYRSGGQIYSSLTNHHKTTLTSGGPMVASNLPVGERYPGSYQDSRGMNGPTFGAVTTWSLGGNSSVGIPAFSDNMYVPAEIRITAPTALDVSKSQPLTVTWNQDGNNESILLVVDYRVDESLMRDSTLTTAKYRWQTVTDDDGSYTINPADLAAIPVGGLMDITLARGISKKSGTASHPFHIYAYSTANAIYAVTP